MNLEILEKYIKALPAFQIPIADCIVYKDHQEIFRCMTGDTFEDFLYWLYSCSKVATCVAVLQLIETGRLSLEDEVSQFIPSFEHMQIQKEDGSLIPADKKITIFHLLTMTAGLTYQIETDGIRELQKNGTATTRNVIDEIAKLPLAFQPGTNYMYSMCHDVLAAVIEVITGQKFSVYMEEYIFKPLGMKSASYHVTEKNQNQIVPFHTFNRKTLRAELFNTTCEYKLSEQYESGGAGILCAVEDYILLADALACAGVGKSGARILTEKSIELMNQNYLNEVQLHAFQSGVGHTGYGYGLGVRTLMNPEEVPTICHSHEFGWAGAAGSYTLVDMKNRISIFFAMQMKGHIDFTYLTHPHNMIRDIVYRALITDNTDNKNRFGKLSEEDRDVSFFHELEGNEKDFSEYILRHSGDETIVYKVVDGESIHLSLYYPPNYDKTKKYPVFVFVHGGGWASHKVFPDQTEWAGDHLGFLARYYAEKGYVSASIDYRLMRDNGQTDGAGLIDLYEDCRDAVHFLKKNAKKFGLDFSQSILLGESAGGYLAGALATLFNGENAVFSKVILVNAITNLMDSRWYGRVPRRSEHPMLDGKSKIEIAYLLSPAWQLSDTTPKTLLIHGEEDVIVHPEHSQCFYDEMRLHNNEAQVHWIKQTNHAFLLVEYMLAKDEMLTAASIAVDLIDEWLKE